MADLKQIMFIEGIIPDKIGTLGSTWALLMGNYLYVLINGKENNKYLLPQTYHSPVYFKEESIIRCHNVEINMATGSQINHDLLSLCKTESDNIITENHVITKVAWVNSTALVTVNFFVPRNQGYDHNDAVNYWFVITGIGGKTVCKKLSQHAYLPLITAQASRRFWAGYYGELHIWQDGIEVEHGVTLDYNLSIENIFITEDEEQLTLVNALGKAISINTSNWNITSELQLQKSGSTLLTAISPNGQLIATGNNEGDCYLYKKNEDGYHQILLEKMEGIITSIHISNSQLFIGLNSNKRRGLICFELQSL